MTTRVLPSFKLFTPTTIEEAVSIIQEYQGVSKILAGGTDILVIMKKRLINPNYLINISKIPNLSFIKYDRKKGLSIGPMTTIREIEKSRVIKKEYRLISEAASTFATIQIQNMATIGGNLCNASPAADLAPPLLVVDAEVDLIGIEGEKNVKLEDFFIGPGKSVIKPDEILTEIRAGALPKDAGSCFIKVGRTAEDLSKVNIATILSIRNNKFSDVKVSLGAVAPIPIRAKKLESFLIGKNVSDKTIDEAAVIASEEVKPITDIRSTAEYRRKVVKVLVKRSIKTALDRVKK
jgi:carbon-monoxide dehydrogenase medium subunit